jgi:hypothetical protein
MDILYFLEQRLQLLGHFYETASSPFVETKRQIEAGEPPFEPPYSEDAEPPFVQEWSQADIALELLGRTCVSMLSDSLKLYFRTWEKNLWVEPPCQKCFSSDFGKGFLSGYLACFGEALGVTWKDCPADLTVLEQVILARNRSQHPESLTSLDVAHDRATWEKHPRLFFARPSEAEMMPNGDTTGSFMLNPSIHVSRENLFSAIEQVQLLASWLEERMFAFKYGRQTTAGPVNER